MYLVASFDLLVLHIQHVCGTRSALAEISPNWNRVGGKAVAHEKRFLPFVPVWNADVVIYLFYMYCQAA